MKQVVFAICLSFLPVAAMAQPAPQDVVVLPRDVAQAALGWIGTPDPMTAVRLYVALNACLNNNPHGGVTTRMGPDQCPSVTQALADRDKQIADLRKQLDAAKKPQEAPKP